MHANLMVDDMLSFGLSKFQQRSAARDFSHSLLHKEHLVYRASTELGPICSLELLKFPLCYRMRWDYGKTECLKKWNLQRLVKN